MIWLVIEGSPPTKNSSRRTRVFEAKGDRPAFAVRHLSGRAKTWRAHLADAWDQAGCEPIKTGTWIIHVRTFWPRRHTAKALPGTDGTVAFGDNDAPLEAIKDALQACGAIDNDARIVAETATKHWDKARPRVEIQLAPWTEQR
jgi:Holliday junction resolvase RusA-like endonuclease